MEHCVLKLFITGDSVTSINALSTLTRACQTELKGKVTLTVVDVRKEPELAEQEKIIATPTLIRERPLPVRRLIGDITSMEILARELNLPVGGNGGAARDDGHAKNKAGGGK
ncbi:MAG TPA: circadian clock KaiB family protein [Planctomycetota bacterium]|nr:circadian clock KaiB family protein [Planctomycetota bacterium]